jgi:O-acetyl-ADP-ribose deacetylase (regulator of RNase III)
MKLYLAERNPDLVAAWQELFTGLPTMTSPEAIPARNCFSATIAILSLASRHPSIDKIFCPELGTGVGCVPPHLTAREMVTAYRKWLSRLVER